MAYLFDDGDSEYLEVTTTPVTAYPFTLFNWFNSDNDTDQLTTIGVGDLSATTDAVSIHPAGSRAGDPMRGRTEAGDSSDYAETGNGFTVGSWYSTAFVCTSNVSRTLYLDANVANKSEDTTDLTPANLSGIDIGTLPQSSKAWYMSGHIAECAIWNVALSEAELAVLADAYSPLFVRPANLVAYWPLIRDLKDIVGGYNLTAHNGPTVSAHPRMIYPRPRIVSHPAAAVGAVAPTAVLSGSLVGSLGGPV